MNLGEGEPCLKAETYVNWQNPRWENNQPEMQESGAHISVFEKLVLKNISVFHTLQKQSNVN